MITTNIAAQRAGSPNVRKDGSRNFESNRARGLSKSSPSTTPRSLSPNSLGGDAEVKDRPVYEDLDPKEEHYQPHCDFCPYRVPMDELRGYARVRMRIHMFFDEPSSSEGARRWSLLIMGLIAISIVAFCMETIEPIADTDFWFILEACVVTIFTFEYLIRMATSSNLRKWLLAPLNLIDLFAVLPFYIEIIGGGGGTDSLRVFRVVRLARVFRLFKVSKYSSYMQIMGKALSKSADAFGLLAFFLLIAVIIFSSIMYFAERGEEVCDANGNNCNYYRPGEKPGDANEQTSPFTSIPATFYWCMVTMTTIGYGDIFPTTIAGKIIACMTMIAGILVIALPVTILGSNFQEVYTDYQRDQEKAKAMEKERRMSTMSVTEAKIKSHLGTIRRNRFELDEILDELRLLVTQAYRRDVAEAKLEARKVKIEEAKEAGVAITEAELKHAETVVPGLEEEAVEVWKTMQGSVTDSLNRIESFLQTRGALLVARTKGLIVAPGVPYSPGKSPADDVALESSSSVQQLNPSSS